MFYVPPKLKFRGISLFNACRVGKFLLGGEYIWRTDFNHSEVLRRQMLFVRSLMRHEHNFFRRKNVNVCRMEEIGGGAVYPAVVGVVVGFFLGGELTEIWSATRQCTDIVR